MFDNMNINTETGFDIFEDSYIPEQGITTGSNYIFGNGYLGYRGTNPDVTKDEYSACIVTNTYDNSDGKWRELCNVPTGLFASMDRLHIIAIKYKVQSTKYVHLKMPPSELRQELTGIFGT